MSALRKLIVPISLIVALVAMLSALASPGQRTFAAGSRVLTLSDMGNQSGCESGAGDTIAGAPFAHAILMAFNKSFVTLFPHAFPGYAAFTVAVGVVDGTSQPGTESLLITVDGKPFKTVTKSYGQAATMITVPFGHASQIMLTARANQKKNLYLLLGNPTVTTVAPKPVATPEPIAGGNNGGGNTGVGSVSTKTTLKLFSASVSAGSQETALITTGHGAELTVVITYPGGSQQVLGPKKAGADGNFAYTWSVPTGMAGIVHVVVVSSSVSQAAFTIH